MCCRGMPPGVPFLVGFILGLCFRILFAFVLVRRRQKVASCVLFFCAVRVYSYQ